MGSKNERVFTLMRELGFKKSDMAEALGISRSAVTQWEKKGTEPTHEQCAILAELFNVSIEEIVDPEELKGLQLDIRKFLDAASTPVFENNTYYTDPEATAIAQKLASTPGAKTLLDAYCDMPKEDAEFILQMVEKLTNK